MSAFRLLVSAVALGAAASAARADDPAWKLDAPYYATFKTEKTTKTTGLGPDSTETKGLTIAYRVTPRTTKKGEIVLKHEIVHFTGDVAAAAAKMYRQAVGSAFEMTYDADMKFLKMTGVTDVVEAACGDLYDKMPKATVKFLESAFETVFIGSTQDGYFPLPAGKKHTKTASKMSIAGMVRYDLSRDYAAGNPGDDDTVAYPFKGAMKLKAVDGESPLPGVKILSAELKDGAKYDGTVTFDVKAGRPAKVVAVAKVVASMTMEAAGRELSGESEEASKSVTTFSTKKPKFEDD